MSETVMRTHKKYRFRLEKKSIVFVHCAFLYISLSLIWRENAQFHVLWSDNEIFFLFLNLGMVPRNSTPRDFAYIITWQSKWGWNNCNEDR